MNKEEVMRKWEESGKKHLLITGDLGRGKTSLFLELMNQYACDYISTHAVYNDGIRPVSVQLSSSNKDTDLVIAKFDKRFHADETVLNTLGVNYLESCRTDIIGVDEVGFLENSAEDYLDALRDQFNKSRVIACVRKFKQSDIVDELKSRDDVYLLDLDEEYYPVDCVVMASGYSKRYGKNKLLEPWDEFTVLEATMEQIPFDMLQDVVVVTRYPEVKELVMKYPVTCIVHSEEHQSDTIRIGVEALAKKHVSTMFLTCDQPLRSKRSLRSMILESMDHPDEFIQLAFGDKRGNPIIFPGQYDDELTWLQPEETGKAVVKRHVGKLKLVKALHPYELFDIDTQERYEELIRIANL